MLHRENRHHSVFHWMIRDQLEFEKPAQNGQSHLHLEIC